MFKRKSIWCWRSHKINCNATSHKGSLAYLCTVHGFGKGKMTLLSTCKTCRQLATIFSTRHCIILHQKHFRWFVSYRALIKTLMIHLFNLCCHPPKKHLQFRKRYLFFIFLNFNFLCGETNSIIFCLLQWDTTRVAQLTDYHFLLHSFLTHSVAA